MDRNFYSFEAEEGRLIHKSSKKTPGGGEGSRHVQRPQLPGRPPGSRCQVPDPPCFRAAEADVDEERQQWTSGRGSAQDLHRRHVRRQRQTGAAGSPHHPRPERRRREVQREHRERLLPGRPDLLPRGGSFRHAVLQHEALLLPGGQLYQKRSELALRQSVGPLRHGREPLGHLGPGVPDDPREHEFGGRHHSRRRQQEHLTEPGVPGAAPGAGPGAAPPGIGEEHKRTDVKLNPFMLDFTDGG